MNNDSDGDDDAAADDADDGNIDNDFDDVLIKLVIDHIMYMCVCIYIYGYGSIPINTIFRGMNIHLPAILMFTRGTRFWHTAIYIYIYITLGPLPRILKPSKNEALVDLFILGFEGPGNHWANLGDFRHQTMSLLHPAQKAH